LVGFEETSPEAVRENLSVDGDRLTSRVNGKAYGCGRLETPSLAELRSRVESPGRGTARLREVVADVQALHREPAHAGALFQAASQFNLLEMVSPEVVPERGVAIYEQDRTQGPACAVACGAGTIYRNYFVPVGGGVGQTGERQIDCLGDLSEALDDGRGSLWDMRNGYALMTPRGLRDLGPRLEAMDSDALDALRGRLRIGLHWDVEVTLEGAGHALTQVYGSALPVAYGGGRPDQWAPLARLVLEASYEATLLAARLNTAATGNGRVFLTLLGGGVFGNPEGWIFGAIERALTRAGDAALDVSLVSYGRSNPAVSALLRRLS